MKITSCTLRASLLRYIYKFINKATLSSLEQNRAHVTNLFPFKTSKIAREVRKENLLPLVKIRRLNFK